MRGRNRQKIIGDDLQAAKHAWKSDYIRTNVVSYSTFLRINAVVFVTKWVFTLQLLNWLPYLAGFPTLLVGTFARDFFGARRAPRMDFKRGGLHNF